MLRPPHRGLPICRRGDCRTANSAARPRTRLGVFASIAARHASDSPHGTLQSSGAERALELATHWGAKEHQRSRPGQHRLGQDDGGSGCVALHQSFDWPWPAISTIIWSASLQPDVALLLASWIYRSAWTYIDSAICLRDGARADHWEGICASADHGADSTYFDWWVPRRRPRDL